MKSKTKIEKQLERKMNQDLVDTIIFTKKNKNWKRVAEILSSSRKNRVDLNLEDINKEAVEGKTFVVPGKVLSQGEISKKVKICALDFSDKAKEKLLKSKCEISSILEEIKKNPDAKGIKILQKK